ncbi:MAG TPA: hypothetical protein PLX69_18775, partial [Leptospiraceae bacterium]|nr:hypothetical protein [Leptospiraceae bacterium]
MIIFIVLGFLLITSVVVKWKSIVSYFSGNSIQKISKLEEKINESLAKKTFPKNLIGEYKAATNLYFETAPIDSTANYLIA